MLITSKIDNSDAIFVLRVYFNAKLDFKDHMHEKINKAYMMSGLINHNFKHMTIPTFVALYKSMVRSHLDYCCPVWSPYRKGDIEALEKVQKRASKMIPALKNLPHKDRLKVYTNMSTLHYRRVRGDMIETYDTF